jgi:hypothetical protein
MYASILFLVIAFFRVWRAEAKKVRELQREKNCYLAPKDAKGLPIGWREKLLLEDELAEKEASLEREEYRVRVFGKFTGVLAGPDKVALLRGEIERWKKKLVEIDGLTDKREVESEESTLILECARKVRTYADQVRKKQRNELWCITKDRICQALGDHADLTDKVIEFMEEKGWAKKANYPPECWHVN